MADVNSGASIRRAQALEVAVHRACRYCNAPGVYSDEPRVRDGWYGCYRHPGDPDVGQPVGPQCPNCGGDRGPSLVERLGIVWRKIF